MLIFLDKKRGGQKKGKRAPMFGKQKNGGASACFKEL